MNETSDLFGTEKPPAAKALARNTDPATSHEAAASVNVGSLEAEILAWLANHPPSSAHQIAEGLQRELVSISPRMKPLEAKGKVVRCKGIWHQVERPDGTRGAKRACWRLPGRMDKGPEQVSWGTMG